jgi:hypothetical protein
MLTRASSIYKRQTRPLVREVAPEKQDRNCQKVYFRYKQGEIQMGSQLRVHL